VSDPDLDDLLDRLVAEYSDALERGDRPSRAALLERAPSGARPGLERCLKMIDAGLGQVPPASRPLRAGLALGRYRLVRELGRGGMAIVWLARDEELQRPVALKLLRPGLALEERHADRFRREALAIAKLRHPGVVQIHDVGSAQGYHYLAMEYVEGPSLATVIAALPADRRRAWSGAELARAAGIPGLAERSDTLETACARLFARVAEALHAAHGLGLVHRDVKPSNILLRRDGGPVVADFGLAKAEGDPALSISGDTLGTPYYMSPEQAWLAETRVDHRTDVYSLGVTLYEALAGRRPFEGATVLQVFEAIRTTIPPALDRAVPRCSRDAAAVCRRAMARDPAARYADARELAEELDALAHGRTTRARRAEGGRLRRALSWAALFVSPQALEYRSSSTLLGLPLVHVIRGPRRPGEPLRVAKGWIASGDVAVGFVAAGPVAFGAVALGGLACGGLFAWGGLAGALLLAFGGVALAPWAIGGLALGWIACGGIAWGHTAIGGIARGTYAAGGDARGTHVLPHDASPEEARRFFEAVLPDLWQALWP